MNYTKILKIMSAAASIVVGFAEIGLGAIKLKDELKKEEVVETAETEE